MQRLFIILICATMTACAGTKKSGFEYQAADTATPFKVTNMPGANNKTMRYITKQQVGQYLCESQSYNHNEQRVITRTSPQAFYLNTITGKMEMVVVPKDQQTVVYDPKTPPFDMIGCINAMNSTTFSKLGSLFINKLGVPLIQYGTGYLVAKNLLNQLNKPTVQGDNNRVVTNSGANSSYTEAGGIPIDGGIDGENLTLGTSESSLLSSQCAAAGGEFIAADSRCSDGNGGTITFGATPVVSP